MRLHVLIVYRSKQRREFSRLFERFYVSADPFGFNKRSLKYNLFHGYRGREKKTRNMAEVNMKGVAHFTTRNA